jgi:hypothetical protein
VTACEIRMTDQRHDGDLEWQVECDPHHWVTMRKTEGEIYDQIRRHKDVVADRDEELRAAGLIPQ